MDERLYLHIPSFEEFDYRQKILFQPDTMSYNKGCELGLDNYDNETGCIDFRKEYWKDWFSRWINNTPDRYYAYIIKSDENIPIGEVALRYVDGENAYCASIIIEAKYRGYGYGEEALRLLIDVAFHELNAKRIFHNFPKTRVSAEIVFKKVGFKRISDDIVELTQENYLNQFNQHTRL
ncbi:GNAT family N-acetyltransferase [Fonticella tunisiensis]|uniref:Diamine N-acetyltransferase n=1 Tax=Fonticella tunisiensis TaxID=1096341 RepID=A0A4R7K561_9CLOT|nr:GNAT family N-acetyltransferase [Fonticella tunisiensis]TDT45654.1 diamine N-acetyltransferase [Fonticella tunisiensis]